MGETRRHSLDVPITRTLVALRRVRSLRDPCTNSMSKFASLLDTVKWETSSTNGISLQFMNNVEDTEASKLDASMGLIPYESYSIMEELEHGCGLHKVLNAAIVEDNFKFGDSCTRSSRSPSESRELACNLPLNGELEDVDSSNLRQRYRSRYSTKLTDSIGDYASRVSSPMTSRTHGFDEDDEIDDVDQFNRGCGITYCWSRTPRFRGSNQSSDVEEYPLLSRNTNESTLQQRGAGGLGESYETLRSLSQKFRPKSFNEVIGQEVVVKCLLSTIFRGRITSFYLFHGPRGTGKTSTSKIFAAALNCLSQAVHTRPCGLCSKCKSGKGKDMMELDSVKLNRSGYLRSLIKSASLPPVSSRFKVFVIDECQLLSEETWGSFLNNLDNVSQHSVFILVTSELEKLPQNVLSRSQKYHFAKVCDLEIANKLVKICMEEMIDFDQEALDFIASKSDGSLRDAEIMLDQLSLVGKRITTSLAYKLIGVVSDDELLDLLDLALSSDTSNTVIRARELMKSKIDPMQLTSQLANVIMDIIAGKTQESSSATRLRFLTRHTSQEEMQKLSNALKILSDAEKHLRASKNQTTWLTVALLQLSNADSSSFATNEAGLCSRSQRSKDTDLCSTSSEGESLTKPARSPCDIVKSETEENQENCKETIESVWKTVTEFCCSDSLKSFLLKRGRLTSLTLDKGVAIAELEFYTPQHVSRAEKSWKLIAESFQSVLGCNVEIRMNLVISACSPPKTAKAASLFFGLFSCSRRMLHSDARGSIWSSGCEGKEMENMNTNALRSFKGNLLRTRSVRSGNVSSRMSSASDQGNVNSGPAKGPEDEAADVLCWKTPLGKGLRETHNGKSSRLIGRVLPCTAAT